MRRKLRYTSMTSLRSSLTSNLSYLVWSTRARALRVSRDGFPGGRNGSASQQRLMAVNVIDITALAETVAEGTRLVVQ